MAQEHDLGAERIGGYILSQIRKGDDSYKQVFSTSMRRIGDWGWPRPDFVCFDDENHTTYALEYKPPMQTKREYVCGLGQSITYLQHHTYSGLIIPEKADDGFPIANYLKDVLNSDVMGKSPISLFMYNPDDFSVQILRRITEKRNETSIRPSSEVDKTFWCWWRDMSHYEVFDLLTLSFVYSEYDGDVYTDYIFPNFWNRLINHQTKDFEGNYRNVQNSSMNSYKQNYRIPFEQLGLWTGKEGKLSDIGFQLLIIGKKYGPDSYNFKNALAYLLLTTGHHIDLIQNVYEIQRTFKIPNSSMEFRKMLDSELTDRGLIGKRKPSAITTNKKGSYIRDEMKLWNKLGLINKRGNEYFFPNEGYDFNWERINNILITGKQW